MAPRFRGVIGLRGDLQLTADRLDPELKSVLVDECDHLLDGRSSSAAKKADADRRIAFALFSSRFSRSSAAMCSASSEDRPGRSPSSTSARCTHPRNVSDGIPSCCPTRVHAPRRPPGSSRAAATNLTARSFNSCGYFDNFGMLPILSGYQKPLPNPGRDTVPLPFKNSGSWVSLIVLAAECREDLTDIGGLAIYVVEQAVGNLKDPKKAVAAAESILGEGYGEQSLAQWTKTATKLQALGIVVSLASMIDWFRKTIVETFDVAVSIDNIGTTHVLMNLKAPARPAPPPPPTQQPAAPPAAAQAPLEQPAVPSTPAPPSTQGPLAPAPAPPSDMWTVSLTRSGDTITYHWQNMPSGMWSQVDRFRCWRYTEQGHPSGWGVDGCGEQTGYLGFPSGSGQVSFTYVGANNGFSVEPWKYGPWLNVGEECGGDARANNC